VTLLSLVFNLVRRTFTELEKTGEKSTTSLFAAKVDYKP